MDLEISEVKLALEKTSSGGTKVRNFRRSMRNEIHIRHHTLALPMAEEIAQSYRVYSPANHRSKERNGKPFKQMFIDMITKGNWVSISEKEVMSSFNTSSKISIAFNVDFGNLKEWTMYRSSDAKTVDGILTYPRVLMRYVFNTGPNVGKQRIALYRDVPTNDIEGLFPEIRPKVSFTHQLKITLSILAGLAIASLNFSRDPELAMQVIGGNFSGILEKPMNFIPLIGVILYLVTINSTFKTSIRSARDEIARFRHDHLLASDDSAVGMLVQMAYDQEAYEEILAAEFIHRSLNPLTMEQLDQKVEGFLQSLGDNSDFEIEDGVTKAVFSGWIYWSSKDHLSPKPQS